MIALDKLQASDFNPLTGDRFTLCTEQASVDLVLDEVKGLGHRRADATRDPFSVLFKGRTGLRLVQGVYILKNETLGSLEIFVAQVGDSAAGSLFEAVFT